jgi:hypothetical protein
MKHEITIERADDQTRILLDGQVFDQAESFSRCDLIGLLRAVGCVVKQVEVERVPQRRGLRKGAVVATPRVTSKR